MGLMSSLDKAMGKLIRNAPKVMNTIMEAEERAERSTQRREETYRSKVRQYKLQYTRLSDEDLLDELNKIRQNDSLNARKARFDACIELFDERGFEIGPGNKMRPKV